MYIQYIPFKYIVHTTVKRTKGVVPRNFPTRAKELATNLTLAQSHTCM
jgi:hypothetical protein